MHLGASVCGGEGAIKDPVGAVEVFGHKLLILKPMAYVYERKRTTDSRCSGEISHRRRVCARWWDG